MVESVEVWGTLELLYELWCEKVGILGEEGIAII